MAQQSDSRYTSSIWPIGDTRVSNSELELLDFFGDLLIATVYAFPRMKQQEIAEVIVRVAEGNVNR